LKNFILKIENLFLILEMEIFFILIFFFKINFNFFWKIGKNDCGEIEVGDFAEGFVL
jgi:hypothetical protein